MTSLNERIAEKKGWEQLDTERYEYPWRGPDGEGYYERPDWEHDIAAAWTLTPYLPTGWWLQSPNRDGAPWVLFWMDENGEPYEEGDTAPAAIVAAFLATQGDE